MSSEKIVIKKKQFEKEINKHIFIADLKIMIINYFEDNYNAMNWNGMYNCNLFIKKLINLFPKEVLKVVKFTKLYYDGMYIPLYTIWHQIEKEYVNNYIRELKLTM